MKGGEHVTYGAIIRKTAIKTEEHVVLAAITTKPSIDRDS